MRNKVAVKHLQLLKAEAEKEGLSFLDDSDKWTSWKMRVESVLTRALGAGHRFMQEFKNIDYDASWASFNMPLAEYDAAFLRGLKKAVGILDVAVFELDDGGMLDDAIDGTAFDPALWAHVKTHVQDENWDIVASQTAIFVEDRIRKWGGDPKGRNGETLVGKALYLSVLGDRSSLKLGKQASESEGWRSLGVGFALALGNVDRHNIQERADAKRYAFGVLGAGSLLLTQLRYQHNAGRPKISGDGWLLD